MATYAETDTLEREASPEDITELMTQKAHELFSRCDKEEKGKRCLKENSEENSKGIEQSLETKG